MELSQEEVLHIALLARLGLDKTEVAKFREQLSDILQNFEVLRGVNTDNVPPTAQSITLHNVVSEDEVAPSLTPDQVMANAPQREGDFFKVRAVLEEQDIH